MDCFRTPVRQLLVPPHVIESKEHRIKFEEREWGYFRWGSKRFNALPIGTSVTKAKAEALAVTWSRKAGLQPLAKPTPAGYSIGLKWPM